MERRIKRHYRKANKELTAKWNAYMDRAGKRISKLQKEYENAKKTGENVSEIKKKLEDAMRNETLRSAQYRAMVDETTTRLANANKIALDYVNDQTADIYATNYNSNKATADKYNVNFTQVDENVIKNLMQEKHLNVQKDKKWNSKKLNSAVLQGILQGEAMSDIAKRIMPICDNNYKSAIRNARTMVTQAENKGRLDGYEELEKEGLILKKVWIATEDDRTRASHLEINGEEVDIDEEFSNGLMYPADPEGDPEEVYNCRCTMVTNVVGKDNKLFEEEQAEDIITKDALENTTSKIFSNFYSKLDGNVEYNPVKIRKNKWKENEIINILSGGDLTDGSCASLGLAYIGQKKFNLDVLDFRDGSSRKFFAGAWNLYELSNTKGISKISGLYNSGLANANAMLKKCVEGKEYYLCVGRHASIVRKKGEKYQYLELQHATKSGWTDFSEDPRNTLKYRFGCKSNSSAYTDFMINIDDSDFSDEFKSLLGYINTDIGKQKKGVGGVIK